MKALHQPLLSTIYGKGYIVDAFSGDTTSPVNVTCPPSLE